MNGPYCLTRRKAVAACYGAMLVNVDPIPPFLSHSLAHSLPGFLIYSISFFSFFFLLFPLQYIPSSLFVNPSLLPSNLFFLLSLLFHMLLPSRPSLPSLPLELPHLLPSNASSPLIFLPSLLILTTSYAFLSLIPHYLFYFLTLILHDLLFLPSLSSLATSCVSSPLIPPYTFLSSILNPMSLLSPSLQTLYYSSFSSHPCSIYLFSFFSYFTFLSPHLPYSPPLCISFLLNDLVQ
jgi:hypothetical protein